MLSPTSLRFATPWYRPCSNSKAPRWRFARLELNINTVYNVFVFNIHSCSMLFLSIQTSTTSPWLPTRPTRLYNPPKVCGRFTQLNLAWATQAHRRIDWVYPQICQGHKVIPMVQLQILQGKIFWLFRTVSWSTPKLRERQWDPLLGEPFVEVPHDADKTEPLFTIKDHRHHHQQSSPPPPTSIGHSCANGLIVLPGSKWVILAPSFARFMPHKRIHRHGQWPDCRGVAQWWATLASRASPARGATPLAASIAAPNFWGQRGQGLRGSNVICQTKVTWQLEISMFSENHKSAGFPIARIGYQWNLQLLTTKSTCPRGSTWSESTAIIACSPAIGVPRVPTCFMGILGCLIVVGKTKNESHVWSFTPFLNGLFGCPLALDYGFMAPRIG